LKSPLCSLAFSRNGRLLASGGDDGSVTVWDPIDLRPLHTYSWQQRPVTCLSFHPSGDRLVSGYEEGDVCLWDLSSVAAPASTDEPRSLEGFESPVSSVVLAGDNRSLVAVDELGTVRRWSLDKEPRKLKTELSGSRKLTFEGHSRPVISLDGIWLAAG